MESKNHLTAKWIQVLIYVAIVSLVNSLVTFLPFVPAAATTWISRGVMVAMVVCMLQLAPVNPRYKKAGVLRAVMFGCTLITVFISVSSILTLAASILSIIAVYQEYSAHSEVIAEKNAKLSRKWHSLFYWSLVSGLMVGFGTMVVVVIAALIGVDAVRITGFVTGLLRVPQIVIDVVYLLYLKKMIGYFQEAEQSGAE